MHSLSAPNKLASWIYFSIVIIVGLLLYKDYGISWDEPVQRGIGNAAYEYAVDGNKDYFKMKDKIYGVAFEIPLIFIEKKLDLKEPRDIFLMRHLVQVLFFAFGCFVFFRLNLRLFGNFKIAIIPTLMLLFSPRIFAHSFFNSKDIPFLCMYIISFSSLHQYLLNPNYLRLILLAVCAGLLVNFRIMGTLFFITAFGVVIYYWIQNRKLKFGIQLFVLVVVSALVLVGTWPYLWQKPLYDFVNSFKMMSKFPWHGALLFRGEMLAPGERLVEYLGGWILITVPILYLLSSFIGALFFLWKTIKKPKEMFANPMKIMGWVFIVNMLVPVAAVLYLHSILYDDWRQLYFIYPPIIIFTGYLIYYLQQWKPQVAKLSGMICICYIGYMGIQMIRLHPYQHVYFNEIVPRKKDYILLHFEQDYWGTGFYDGLKYLAKNDDSDSIKVFLFSDALRRNSLLLPEKDRKRFVFLQNEGAEKNSTKGEEESDYYITNFRYDPADLIGNSHFKTIVFEVRHQNSPIIRVWKH